MHEYLNEDCIEYLKTLQDSSVDLILTDPPYFIGFDGGKGWDKQWNSDQDYLDWCEKWSKECARVLKPNKMMCVFGTLKYNTFLRYRLEVLDKLPNFHQQPEIIWSYNWGGRSKTNFARKHEFIWCYSKEKTFTFNADRVRTERKQKVNIRTGKEYEQGTIPTCVWEKNNHTTSKEYCNWHPTQKPISILERFIEAYTNPGETVLDIFNGAGSTMIACENTGRIFKGCEIDPDYYEQSITRYTTLTGKQYNNNLINQIGNKP